MQSCRRRTMYRRIDEKKVVIYVKSLSIVNIPATDPVHFPRRISQCVFPIFPVLMCAFVPQDPQASYDVNNHDEDPMPRYDMIDSNRHGTRCAGEVAATANNSLCAVGIAFGANVGGMSIFLFLYFINF